MDKYWYDYNDPFNVWSQFYDNGQNYTFYTATTKYAEFDIPSNDIILKRIGSHGL